MTKPSNKNDVKPHVFSLLSLGFWEHFDMALFSFLAPAIASKMGFKTLSGLWGYGVLASSALTYPLGAMLFTWLSLRKNVGYALCYAVLGLALCTFGLALLPLTWESAPFFLVLLRCIQSICVSGERALSHLYLLDQVSPDQIVQKSGQFQLFIMLGIFMALLAGKWISDTQNWILWHVLLVLCSFMMLIFYYQRRSAFSRPIQPVQNPIHIWKNRSIFHFKQMISITALSAFSYVTYALVFQFFPAWLPLFSDYSFTNMLSDSVLLMSLDILLLLCLPYAFKKHATFSILYKTLLGFMLTWIPLLTFVFVHPFLFYGIRMFWMFAGVLYAIHLMVFFKQTIQGPFRYLEIGLWSLLGSALGHTTTFNCLWLFQKTHHIVGTGIYLTLITFIAWKSLCFLKRNA